MKSVVLNHLTFFNFTFSLSSLARFTWCHLHSLLTLIYLNVWSICILTDVRILKSTCNVILVCQPFVCPLAVMLFRYEVTVLCILDAYIESVYWNLPIDNYYISILIEIGWIGRDHECTSKLTWRHQPILAYSKRYLFSSKCNLNVKYPLIHQYKHIQMKFICFGVQSVKVITASTIHSTQSMSHLSFDQHVATLIVDMMFQYIYKQHETSIMRNEHRCRGNKATIRGYGTRKP